MYIVGGCSACKPEGLEPIFIVVWLVAARGGISELVGCVNDAPAVNTVPLVWKGLLRVEPQHPFASVREEDGLDGSGVPGLRSGGTPR